MLIPYLCHESRRCAGRRSTITAWNYKKRTKERRQDAVEYLAVKYFLEPRRYPLIDLQQIRVLGVNQKSYDVRETSWHHTNLYHYVQYFPDEYVSIQTTTKRTLMDLQGGRYLLGKRFPKTRFQMSRSPEVAALRNMLWANMRWPVPEKQLTLMHISDWLKAECLKGTLRRGG